MKIYNAYKRIQFKNFPRFVCHTWSNVKGAIRCPKIFSEATVERESFHLGKGMFVKCWFQNAFKMLNIQDSK